MGNIKPTVVGIENSPSMRKFLERSIETLDIELHVFSSAEDGWHYLQSNTPDLIILSIILPGKDGLSLLKDIRESPNHKEIPVIILSSKNYAQDRIIATQLGVTEFMLKPMPVKAITDIITKYTQSDCGSHNS